MEAVRSGAALPYMVSDEKNRPVDFSCMPLGQYGDGYGTQRLNSFSELLERFYDTKEKQENARVRAQVLLKTVKTARDRLTRKFENQRRELEATEGRDRLRELGNIVTANIHLMSPGMRALTANDFYAEDNGEVTIGLDPRKTPQENAAKYFKDYAKAKNAQKVLTQQLEEGRAELQYLESVLDELSRADSAKDIAEIRQELERLGYAPKKSTGKKEKELKSAPLQFVSSAGLGIRVGRNNVCNDELTLRLSSKNDLWFHAKNISGAHVVLSSGGGEADARSIHEAASLAAFFSQAREAGKVPVDYTLIRYVRKPAGAKPGMVIYTDQHTIMAEPKEKL
jgi:predicted ribosome quality control (RQC) complex YloA/Tae2 family protein